MPLDNDTFRAIMLGLVAIPLWYIGIMLFIIMLKMPDKKREPQTKEKAT